MLLYSSKLSPRLVYITGFFEKQLFGEGIQITTDKEAFRVWEGPKINYSSTAISANECWIANTGILFETGLRTQSIRCFEVNGYKAFFATPGTGFPFDIFAASFYLLSRYEEYLPHHKDEYGRFAHTGSLAFKENFLHQPLVNIWLNHLKKVLLEKCPETKIHTNNFHYIPTYDIDIAYSYTGKGWWRNLAGGMLSVVKGEFKRTIERVAVLLKKESDPFDVYDWLNNLHEKTSFRPVYFFLLAEKPGGYDRNIPFKSLALKKLIVSHANRYTTGIHPSWQSGHENDLLKREIQKLSAITGKAVLHSRQHYIKMSFPGTYRKLISLGIRKEYSMGYGSINGFRASVASSFYWYDLNKEETTDLRIYPFCFMDANSFYEQKMTSDEALRELISYYHAIQKVNGLMVTIWHNNFLGTDPSFSGWRDIYESFFATLKSGTAK